MRGVTKEVETGAERDGFQPALPMRGVTRPTDMSILSVLISTRTPHAGSDELDESCKTHHKDFNPHSPCGE